MDQQHTRKTYQYKLTPTLEQEQVLERVLWRCRTLYNTALDERQTAWERGHIAVGYYEQKTKLPDLKRACPEFADGHSQALQDVLSRLDWTFQACFRRIKNGEQPGYARFQGRNRSLSFAYPQYGNGVVLDRGIPSLSKIGRIPIRVQRPLEGTPKTVTIACAADGRYACSSCAEVPTEPLHPTGRETGIDVRLTMFLVTADGEPVANPRHFRKSEQPITKAQRHVARRQRGSRRRAKAVVWLRRTCQKVQRQRRHFHHTTALTPLRANDTSYLEDVRVGNMARNHHLAKSTSDAAWRLVRTILDGKAADAGRRVVAVPPAYTSQDWSGCGERTPMSLRVHPHVCSQCGLVLERDEHAARNIQWAEQTLRGVVASAAAVNRKALCLQVRGACHTV